VALVEAEVVLLQTALTVLMVLLTLVVAVVVTFAAAVQVMVVQAVLGLLFYGPLAHLTVTIFKQPLQKVLL
jgi:hypothetical protein